MGSLSFDLHAAGVVAPGLASLADLQAAARSGRPPAITAPLTLPAPAGLPPNERRRASQVVRLTLTCIDQALQTSPFPVEVMRSVFATDEGTGEICGQMLEALATTRQISPLAFANSVLNAPAGSYSIAWRTRQSATVASLGLESFAAGLLCAVTEAASTHQPVLFVAYDPAMVCPLNELLPVTEPVATAWVLGSSSPTHAPALGSFALELCARAAGDPTPLPAWVPPRWAAHSSARGLAALGMLDDGPDEVCRLTLGHQVLALRRVA